MLFFRIINQTKFTQKIMSGLITKCRYRESDHNVGNAAISLFTNGLLYIVLSQILMQYTSYFSRSPDSIASCSPAHMFNWLGRLDYIEPYIDCNRYSFINCKLLII